MACIDLHWQLPLTLGVGIPLILGDISGKYYSLCTFLALFNFRRYHCLRRISNQSELICILLLVFLGWNFVLFCTVSNDRTTHYPTESRGLGITCGSLWTYSHLHHIVFHGSSLRFHYRGCSVLQHQLIILFCNPICHFP